MAPQQEHGLGKEARQDAIAALILEQQSVQAADLAARFGVSLMTVHRDLDELTDQGLVRRFHGGAAALRSSYYEPDVAYRLRLAQSAKREIAATAVEMIEDGSSVLLDDSTSSLAVAKLLPGRSEVTAITSFLDAMKYLSRHGEVALIGLGGDYVATTRSFQGNGLLVGLAQLHADLYFASVAAINVDGIYHPEPEVITAKRAMMAHSSRHVLLMDHTKLGHHALHRLGSVSDWDAIIVDSQSREEDLDALRSAGANIIVAAPLAPQG